MTQPVLGWAGQRPLDMAVRGPKVFPKLTRVWSREHAEEAKRFKEVREALRKKYGRS